MPDTTISPDTLVYGLGRSGRGTARFLVRESGLTGDAPPFAWFDAKPSPDDRALMAALSAPEGDPRGSYALVIAAPGVPLDHPDLEALRESGARIIGEAELVYETHPDWPIIGVTGTAGKGGTSQLVHQLLCALDVDAGLGGNFDPPLTDLVGGCEVAVCELSSFQLERVERFRPEVAVITNLGVDHLDRHGSVESYHAAKLNITRNQTEEDTLIVPEGLEVQTRAKVVRFSGERLVNLDGVAVMDPAELPEGHHPANAAAALLAADAYLKKRGRVVTPQEWQAAFARTSPVPGRFETVATLGGVRFVEDSIATRTLSVLSALERAQAPVAWLLGGRDKGADLEALEELARQKVTQLIGFGEHGERFARHFERACGLPVTLVPGTDGAQVMREAVRAGYTALSGGGTVLLAPIGTSFDLFVDYKARGAAFTTAARELAREGTEARA